MTLEWSGKEGAEYQVEVSRDTQFKSKVLQESTKHTRFPVLVEEGGAYYWRYQETGGAWSKAGRFELEREQRKATKPEAKKAVVSDQTERTTVPHVGQAPELQFEWQRHIQAVAYQIDIYRDPQGTQRVFQSERLRTNRLDVVIDALIPGIYYWQTRHLDYRGRTLSSTSLRQIQVNSQAQAQVSELTITTPISGVVVKEASVETSGILSAGGVLEIDGKPVALVSGGAFRTTVALNSGENLIVYKWRRPNGTVTIEHRKVFRE
jgi:hypothetical protein